MDTSPLIGHPTGPFYIFLALTHGEGTGDANNTVTVSNLTYGGGVALGSPLALGGTSGSLETGIAITDSSFLSLFYELFSPGTQLSFTLGWTSSDDAGGTPDRLSFSILDSSGVPLPTLAPFGDYLLGVDLRSTGSVFDLYGSDVSRSPSAGDPVSIPAPTLSSSSAPEPSTIMFVGSAVLALVIRKHRFLLSLRGRAE